MLQCITKRTAKLRDCRPLQLPFFYQIRLKWTNCAAVCNQKSIVISETYVRFYFLLWCFSYRKFTVFGTFWCYILLWYDYLPPWLPCSIEESIGFYKRHTITSKFNPRWCFTESNFASSMRWGQAFIWSTWYDNLLKTRDFCRESASCSSDTCRFFFSISRFFCFWFNIYMS